MQNHPITKTPRGPIPIPLAARFWAKVEKGEGCWTWKGTCDRRGYGRIYVGSRPRRSTRAPRVSWELHFGPILDGMFVCHHCDTPSCVRPDHLFLGTARDNARDMVTKGRARQGRCSNQVFGERHGMAKLTDSQVADIRQRYALGGISHRKLAGQYAVSFATIARLLEGKSWTHVV
ncbi:MAG: HNH endonuclease [Dehalococcoidia bacterium]|nr:HNH endonuclease [Dehalococcoidia bacterium]